MFFRHGAVLILQSLLVEHLNQFLHVLLNHRIGLFAQHAIGQEPQLTRFVEMTAEKNLAGCWWQKTAQLAHLSSNEIVLRFSV